MDCTTKTCTKCKADKPLSEFNQDPRYRLGVTGICKLCKNKSSAQNYRDNIDEKRTYHRDYARKRWVNDQEYRSYQREYQKSPEQTANHRRLRQLRYLRDKSDPLYQEKRRPQACITSATRRARKRNNGGSFTLQEWSALCDKYGNKCLKCGKTGELLHADHVIPLARGGRSDIANLQPLCGQCNRHKSAKHIDYRPND